MNKWLRRNEYFYWRTYNGGITYSEPVVRVIWTLFGRIVWTSTYTPSEEELRTRWLAI